MTEIHKNILRILLIALAVTATAGVLSILMQNEMMGRVTGTGFFAVLAALLMLKISTSLENPKLRASSLFGIVIVAFEFMVIVGLIWTDMFNSNIYSELWATFFVVLFWSLFTALAIRALVMEFSRVAGRVGLSFATVSIVAAMIGIWVSGNADEKLAGAAVTFGVMGLAISCCCIGLGVKVEGLPPRNWRWIGIVAGGLSVVSGLIAIWTSTRNFDQSTAAKIASIAGLIAIYTGFASMCMLTPLKSNQRWLLQATLGVALILAGLIAAAVFEFGDDSLMRYIGATAIPTACGTIALAVVARMNKRVEFEMSSPAYLLIHLTCPRCRAEQQVKPGKSRCDRCQLKFDIQVEEPKCPSCNYLLYMLEGDHCPECGTAITTTVGPPLAADAVASSQPS